MRKQVSRLIKKIQIFNNQRKLKFEIIKDKLPRLKVQEKYEKTVVWAIRALTAISIIFSVITFSKWYYALSFSVGLFLLSKILEKMVFTYPIIIVQPMPEKWNGAAWTMMVIGMFDNKFVLAFGFDDKDVATDFFDTILYWNIDVLPKFIHGVVQ